MNIDILPILATQTQVLFPKILIKLNIVNEESVALINELYALWTQHKNTFLGIIPYEHSEIPLSEQDFCTVGTIAKLVTIRKSSDLETRKTGIHFVCTFEGLARFSWKSLIKSKIYFETREFDILRENLDQLSTDSEFHQLSATLRKTAADLALVLENLNLPSSLISQLSKMMNNSNPSQLADLLANMIDVSFEEKISVLGCIEIKPRIKLVLNLVTRQLQVLSISKKLALSMETKIGKKNRELHLRQQLASIKKELGEDEQDDTSDAEIADLEKRLNDTPLPEDAAKIATREMKRLKRINPQQAEYQVNRTWLELLCDMPWSIVSNDDPDVEAARNQLDEDHFGLNEVKKRILEYLAVKKLKKGDMRGPILCFVGAPGVGKTSLGKSIATALGRKFYRISLGGVRDEAEIRGHRRTYVGAMPGLIVQTLKRVGVRNPVILLDEIDKISRDNRGDPAAALLEVLDPEQNSTFTDHYLNLPFDLSNVLFIATANELDTIPKPLLDRMEIISIPGYTFPEKMFIAKKYLLPKQISAHALNSNQINITDEMLLKIATGYTREAGVRSLERQIAALCRGIAVDYVNGEKIQELDDEKITKILGPVKFDDEVSERSSIPGIVSGMAWTSDGAGEATQSSGKGGLMLTGKLGDVIKESAQLGLTWVRANCKYLGLDPEFMANKDLHIHFPAGAIPKDGPSAGVTIVTAIVSLLLNKAVMDYTAMTGEMTLRGLVLPVGGIKEKVLAAHRAGIKRVILPLRNKKDVAEIPLDVQASIEFYYATFISDVLLHAFEDGIELVRGLEHERHEWSRNAVTSAGIERLLISEITKLDLSYSKL